jgi:N-acyl-D-aspartate/D-glutamate deacylase
MIELDLLIKNLSIVDGSGRPAYKGDIGIKGERIAAVGDIKGDASREIEGIGYLVSPGFVDTHSHVDWSILRYPLVENFVMQGITMFLGGNCGNSLAPLKDLVSSPFLLNNALFIDEWWSELELNKPVPDCISLDTLDEYCDLIEKKIGFKIDWRTFDEFLSKVERSGLSINYVPLVGHSTIRSAVMGEDWRREATEEEIEEMKAFVEEAMISGAFGMSSFFDLIDPGEYAAVDEVIELVKIVQKLGGIYSPHKRHHRSNWFTEDSREEGYGIAHVPPGEIVCGRYHGLLETIEIGRITKTPLLLAHLVPAYSIPQPCPDYLLEAAAKATIDIIDNAKREGLKIFFNAIAHYASIHSPKPIIRSFFNKQLSRPEWLEKMTKQEFVEKLDKSEFRDEVKKYIYSGRFKFEMFHPLLDPYWTDLFSIIECKNREYVGKTIGEIARSKCPDHVIDAQYDESFNTLFDILCEDPDTMWVGILDKRERQEALRIFLQHSEGMPCTDCAALPSKTRDDALPSRVAYGMFPHYIDKFVKEENVLSLEEAVQRITYLPAQKLLGLNDRGVIRKNAYADLVLFDYKKIRMAGTYFNPTIPPEGIAKVLVNGKIVYENLKHTALKPGKVLRHKP